MATAKRKGMTKEEYKIYKEELRKHEVKERFKAKKRAITARYTKTKGRRGRTGRVVRKVDRHLKQKFGGGRGMVSLIGGEMGGMDGGLFGDTPRKKRRRKRRKKKPVIVYV